MSEVFCGAKNRIIVFDTFRLFDDRAKSDGKTL